MKNILTSFLINIYLVEETDERSTGGCLSGGRLIIVDNIQKKLDNLKKLPAE